MISTLREKLRIARLRSASYTIKPVWMLVSGSRQHVVIDSLNLHDLIIYCLSRGIFSQLSTSSYDVSHVRGTGVGHPQILIDWPLITTSISATLSLWHSNVIFMTWQCNIFDIVMWNFHIAMTYFSLNKGILPWSVSHCYVKIHIAMSKFTLLCQNFA
jgi:hypothetical protein